MARAGELAASVHRGAANLVPHGALRREGRHLRVRPGVTQASPAGAAEEGLGQSQARRNRPADGPSGCAPARGAPDDRGASELGTFSPLTSPAEEGHSRPPPPRKPGPAPRPPPPARPAPSPSPAPPPRPAPSPSPTPFTERIPLAPWSLPTPPGIRLRPVSP